MDDNYIVNRIVNILNSESQNLVKGNISSPRPGSICQVSTDYGIKDAYNINCTYPGDAYVIWDKDEECYYCFTDKPGEVISSRQLSYRKYKAVKTKEGKDKYILLLDSDIVTFTSDNTNKNNSLIFFENLFKKLNPKYNKLYIGIGNVYSRFFGYETVSNRLPILDAYLTAKGIQLTYVKDTELNKVDDILWLPLFYAISSKVTSDYISPAFNTQQLNTVKNIATKYGVILQSEWGSWDLGYRCSKYYLDTFYNSFNTPKITELSSSGDYVMYSNISINKDTPIYTNGTGRIDSSLLKDENVMAYDLDTTTNTKYATIIYWKNK